MSDKKAMKLALFALDIVKIHYAQSRHINEAITALKERLAQPEQEPVAWLLTDKNINSLQVDSIQRLINRLNHAHHTDLCVRINGQNEWFQADWLKYMVRATPPQRTWVGLTADEYAELAEEYGPFPINQIEAKLKEKNGYTEEKNT